MNTGIDLFIADLPGLEETESYVYGQVFKSHCEDNGGVFTTPSSQSEVDAILQVKDIDSSCQYMIIAAYGAGPTNALTFYTDDTKAKQLTYKNWKQDYPWNDTDVANRCTFMDLVYNGVWSNESCDNRDNPLSGNQCGLCRASPCGGCGGGKLAFLPT